MKSPCGSSLEPQGSSWIRRADPAPPALPPTGAAPGLTLLTTMKPLESMLMPLCLRKPVAGTAPGVKPKVAAGVSRVPQPWGLILRPFLLPGQWGCPQGQAAAALGVWSRARNPRDPTLHQPLALQDPCPAQATTVVCPPPFSSA